MRILQRPDQRGVSLALFYSLHILSALKTRAVSASRRVFFRPVTRFVQVTRRFFHPTARLDSSLLGWRRAIAVGKNDWQVRMGAKRAHALIFKSAWEHATSPPGWRKNKLRSRLKLHYFTAFYCRLNAEKRWLHKIS
jgi:hypothetical protein